MYVFSYTHMGGGQNSTSSGLPQELSILLLETVLLTGLDFTDYARLASQ